MDRINLRFGHGPLILSHDGSGFSYCQATNLRPGECITARDARTGLYIAHLLVTAKGYARFGNLPLVVDGREAFRSREEMREIFSRYYHHVIHPAEPMTILKFHQLAREEYAPGL